MPVPRCAEQPGAQHVQPLRVLGQLAARADQRQRPLQRSQALAAALGAAQQALAQPQLCRAQLRGELGGMRHSQLSRRCRGRRPQIGGEIGDREVGLMTDCRDHRNAGAGNRPRYGFFIEGPQFLQ
ncbi:hypothetical protein D3C80_1641910 [compost metagenome]